MSQTSGRSDPPKHSRFKKGQSGNPKGRPRKPRPAPASGSPFDVVIDRTLTISAGGEEREVDVEEALLHKTLQKALDGNRPARRKILKMIGQREAVRARMIPQPRKGQGPVSVKLEHADPFEPNEAMLILGIARKDPTWGDSPGHMTNDDDRLLLEPWAVQIALGRRRGGTALTKSQVDDIRRSTHDRECIRWPRETDQ